MGEEECLVHGAQFLRERKRKTSGSRSSIQSSAAPCSSTAAGLTENGPTLAGFSSSAGGPLSRQESGLAGPCLSPWSQMGPEGPLPQIPVSKGESKSTPRRNRTSDRRLRRPRLWLRNALEPLAILGSAYLHGLQWTQPESGGRE